VAREVARQLAMRGMAAEAEPAGGLRLAAWKS
jgi:hypothetical protein